MALLVWFTMGIALWHFTVFLPDHFWQGIVGAFIGAVIGAIVFGAIVEIATGKSLGDTDLTTALIAIPGIVIGLAVVWAIGVRERAAASASRGGSPARFASEFSPARSRAVPADRARCTRRCSFGKAAGGRPAPTASLGWWRNRSRHTGRSPTPTPTRRALAEELELSEPVAITLVRRGYRTPEEARAFLEADESHDPFEFGSMGDGGRAGAGGDRGRRADHRPRRLRRRRGLRDDDPGRRPARAGRRLRLADPGPDRPTATGSRPRTSSCWRSAARSSWSRSIAGSPRSRRWPGPRSWGWT